MERTQSRPSDRSPVPWSAYAAVGLSVLAPFLGGSTQLWAQATLCLGCGLLLVAAPPRRSLGFLPNLSFVALALLAAAAFLPEKWFPVDDLHASFARLGIPLPTTRSPQPWLSLQAACLFLLALAWAYYLVAFNWDRRPRLQTWLIYSTSVLILAVTLAIANALHARIPFWPDVREFGFFPNRNQTSNVLALGGIMIYGAMLQSFRQHTKMSWPWLVGLGLICWALILNYSRSGILLFFGGALACHLAWLKTSKWRQRALITLGGLVVILALFIAVGGETLTRLSGSLFLPFEDARMGIYRDAFAFLPRVPFLGIGLGNFGAVFATHRQSSLAQNTLIHPESDFLWAAIELGWLAPVILILLFIWWIGKTRPFEPGTYRLMRIAATICGCAFALHGMFDVSGHRLGSVFPALFLIGTAIHPAAKFKSSQMVAFVFRIVGVVLVGIGLWWFASIKGVKTWPTTADVSRIMEQMESAIGHNDYARAREVCSQGLEISPLDWSLYYKRGAAEAALYYSNTDARRDFGAARFLLPYWPELCFKEGSLWLAVGEPDLAFDAWTEALRRSHEKAAGLYSQMFNLVKSDVDLRDRLRALARTDKTLTIIYLQNAEPLEFSLELERLLAEDRQAAGPRKRSELRSFSRSELRALFSSWYAKGDKADLIEILKNNPEWQKLGWRELARAYADRENFKQACETVKQFSAPEIPPPRTPPLLEQARARFLMNRTNIDAGLNVYYAELQQGNIDQALATIHELAALPDSPKYLSWLESQLWAEKQDWPRAWQALARFTLIKG